MSSTHSEGTRDAARLTAEFHEQQRPQQVVANRRRVGSSIRAKQASIRLQACNREALVLSQLEAEIGIELAKLPSADKRLAEQIVLYLQRKRLLSATKAPRSTSLGRSLSAWLETQGFAARRKRRRRLCKPTTPRLCRAPKSHPQRKLRREKIVKELRGLAESGDVSAISALRELSFACIDSPLGAEIVSFLRGQVGEEYLAELKVLYARGSKRGYLLRLASFIAESSEQGSLFLLEYAERISQEWGNRQAEQTIAAIEVLSRRAFPERLQARLDILLAKILEHTQLPRELRLFALEKCGTIDLRFIAPSLLALAAHDPNRRIRLTATRVLRERGPLAVYPLLSILSVENDAKIARTAVEIMVKIGKRALQAAQPELFVQVLPDSLLSMQRLRTRHALDVRTLRQKVRTLLLEFEEQCLPRILNADVERGSLVRHPLPVTPSKLRYLAAALSVAALAA